MAGSRWSPAEYGRPATSQPCGSAHGRPAAAVGNATSSSNPRRRQQDCKHTQNLPLNLAVHHFCCLAHICDQLASCGSTTPCAAFLARQLADLPPTLLLAQLTSSGYLQDTVSRARGYGHECIPPIQVADDSRCTPRMSTARAIGQHLYASISAEASRGLPPFLAVSHDYYCCTCTAAVHAIMPDSWCARRFGPFRPPCVLILYVGMAFAMFSALTVPPHQRRGSNPAAANAGASLGLKGLASSAL